MDRLLVLPLLIGLLLVLVNDGLCECPLDNQGMYLMHKEVCYLNGSYFFDADIKSMNNKVSCTLPDITLGDEDDGGWVTPNEVSVVCPTSTGSLHCNIISSALSEATTTFSLYRPEQNPPAIVDGWYKCCLPTNCSDPNTNIIFANIFRWAQIENISVDLPSDMTVLPQTFALHAIKIGSDNHGAFLRHANCCTIGDGQAVDKTNGRWDFTVTVTWKEENITSGAMSQPNNTGDHEFRFFLEFGHIDINHHIPRVTRNRYIFVTAPATAPSSLTEVSKTATTITVSWTALGSSDADGYVVNVTNDTDTVQTVQVEGSSNDTLKVEGLEVNTTYSITVRAYQQLLGPASSTISVQTLPVIIVSSIIQPNSTTVDCLTPTSTDVYWLVNGVMKSSSHYSEDNGVRYNTLLVYPDQLEESVNVTCIAMIGGVSYSQSVILHAPSGPPDDVRGFILNATSIKVNWTNLSETNGYVIEYTTGGVTRNVVSTSEDEIVLTDPSPMSTYTISVYSYIDLPSVNSTVTVLKLDVPSPVTSLSVSNVSTTGITVNWTIPSSDNYVTYYTISYTPSCPQSSSVNQTVSVAPHQSTTTYSYTLIGLYSGMNYTITVRAGNVLGGSDPNSIDEDTLSSSAPTNIPDNVTFIPVNNNLTWNEVDCSERNGLITGYTVMISNSSITYNLTSTERYIILNDLVFGPEYIISVAAVNSVGRGPFSDPIQVEIRKVSSSLISSLMTLALASTAKSVSTSSMASTSVSALESGSASELVSSESVSSESVSSGSVLSESVSASESVSSVSESVSSVSESVSSESVSATVLESASVLASATVLESASKLVSGSVSAAVSMSSSVSLESASNQIPVIGGVIGVVLIIIIIVIITLLIIAVIIQRKKRYSKSDKQPLELPLTVLTNDIIKEDNKYTDSSVINDNSMTDKDTSVRVEPEYAVINKKNKKEKESEEVPIQQQQLPLYEPTYTDIEALKLSPHHIYNEPSFDPLIPATLPVSMEELGNHVATCHSNGFEEQYK
uniref:Fibronectin type-III domain-containing protein n=1 Tax=Amphimedon queenslandica TaxID=400682 RepID=A0A1X7V1E1_AMPQE